MALLNLVKSEKLSFVAGPDSSACVKHSHLGSRARVLKTKTVNFTISIYSLGLDRTLKLDFLFSFPSLYIRPFLRI